MRTLYALFAACLFAASAGAHAEGLDWVFTCGDATHPDYFADIENLEKSGVSPQAIRETLNTRLPTQPLGMNQECLYDVVLRYGDDTTLKILKARIQDNARPILIDGNYLQEVSKDDDVPACVVTRLKKIKGKTFSNAQAYETALRRLLTKKDYSAYGQVLLQVGRLDPENYSEDLYNLLRLRDARYRDKGGLLRQVRILKHPVSYEYFMNRHLSELDIPSQLDVLLDVVSHVFRNGPEFDYYAASRLEQIHETHPEDYRAFVQAHPKDLPDVFRCVIDGTCP